MGARTEWIDADHPFLNVRVGRHTDARGNTEPMTLVIDADETVAIHGDIEQLQGLASRITAAVAAAAEEAA